MIVGTNSVASNINYDANAVEKILIDTAHAITMVMVQALMVGHTENLTFAALADKHTLANLESVINKSDDKMKMIYKKMFPKTKEHVISVSPPLTMTLKLIDEQKKVDKASDDFLGSFVWAATENLMVKLLEEHPNSLNDKKFWTAGIEEEGTVTTKS